MRLASGFCPRSYSISLSTTDRSPPTLRSRSSNRTASRIAPVNNSSATCGFPRSFRITDSTASENFVFGRMLGGFSRSVSTGSTRYTPQLGHFNNPWYTYAPQLPHSVSSSAGGGVRLVGMRGLYQNSVSNDGRRGCLRNKERGLTTAIRRDDKHAHPLRRIGFIFLIQQALVIQPFHLIVDAFFFRQCCFLHRRQVQHG